MQHEDAGPVLAADLPFILQNLPSWLNALEDWAPRELTSCGFSRMLGLGAVD